jgi:ATP-dependent DNA helicase RecG
MTIPLHVISDVDRERLLARDEGQFLDFKAKEISPGKLTRSLSAFSNADGGELVIGAAQVTAGGFIWDGFPNDEAANGHIQCFDAMFALGQGFSLDFLKCDGVPGLLLRANIQKTRDIKLASDSVAYIRRGAQNLPVNGPEARRNLERAKGVVSFEDERLPAARTDVITNSVVAIEFMLEVIPNGEPSAWLQKQNLIADGAPTVSGIVLFAEEPQIFVPKGAIKIYRYRTTEREGSREALAFDPLTVEGHVYRQIADAVRKARELTEQIQIMTEDGLRNIKYPPESLHEIITNAVLHRDYALNDDVHVRIFDNRIEVESPGRLPAHITPSNILSERFARNPKIVRLINKFPNPPNKDVGEGLNTAFRAMTRLRLREPQIIERENSVLVSLLHEKLASPEQQIVEAVREQGTITNSEARRATGIESEVKVRALLQNLVKAGELEQVPGTARATSAYRRPHGKR